MTDPSTMADDATLATKIKADSLKGAGIAYLLGDAAFFVSGLLEPNYARCWSAVSYAGGAGALALFGNPKAEKRLELLYQDLGAHLKQKGFVLPRGAEITTATLARKSGLIDQVTRFLYNHPSEVFNAFNTAAGLALFRSGRYKNKAWQQESGKPYDKWETAAGISVMAGALAGMLIQEHHPKEGEKAPDSAPGKLWSWIQEKPLRVTGTLFMANNVFMAVSGAQGKKAKEKGYLFKYVGVASYVLANILTMMSVKNNVGASNDRGLENKTLRALEKAALQIVVAQPPEVQDAVIKATSEHMGSRKDLGVTAATVETHLREALAAYRASHPAHAEAGRWQARTQTHEIEAVALR